MAIARCGRIRPRDRSRPRSSTSSTSFPYAGAAHPCYREPIPAFESIKGSITVNRGCSGGCSFCALTLHQGKDVVSRSSESVVREVKELTHAPHFNGIVSDLGGPTANMFHMRCTSEAAGKVCRRISCLHPTRCKHYGTDQKPYIDLLREVRSLPGVKRVFVNSGLRYDLAALDPEIVEEIATHHVSGTLTTAPEHTSPRVLMAMRKPEITHFQDFMTRFHAASRDADKKQIIVPYFQCAHPGAGPDEAIELALYLKHHGLAVRQVQIFMPTPGTISTAMYVWASIRTRRSRSTSPGDTRSAPASARCSSGGSAKSTRPFVKRSKRGAGPISSGAVPSISFPQVPRRDPGSATRPSRRSARWA